MVLDSLYIKPFRVNMLSADDANNIPIVEKYTYIQIL